MVDRTIHLASLNVACFVTSFLLEGLQRCSGIFFNGTLELTDEDRQTASIPFIVSRATAYVTSVIFKNVIQKQKLEISLLFGTLLCAVGAGLSFVSNEVIWLSISWGLFFGTGFGVVYPENLKVSQKFRSQTLLPVIYSAAASFACMILPFFMQFLFSRFGLSGCFLILSGIILNAVPFILISIYKINFNLWNFKCRVKKKYEVDENRTVNNNFEEPKNKLTSDGFNNDGFEMENDSNLGSHEYDESPQLSIDRTEIKTSGKGSSFKNKNLIPANDADTILENCSDDSSNKLSEIIPACRKDTKSVGTNRITNSDLLEKTFSGEDILFEAKSNSFRNELISGNNNLPLLADEVSCFQIAAENASCQSRRRTLSKSKEKKNSFPRHIEVNVLKKNTVNGILNNATNISNEVEIEISPRRASTKSSQSRVNCEENVAICIPETSMSTSCEGIRVSESISQVDLQNVVSSSPDDATSGVSENELNEIKSEHVDDINNKQIKSQLSLFNPIRRDFPLEIRVHVVECTFTSQEIIEGKLFERTKSSSKRNGYRRHSNSLITSQFENIDFTSPHLLKKSNKSSNIGGYSNNPSSTMYLISEDEEFGSESNRTSHCGETLNETPKRTERKSLFSESLKKLFKPSCLVIVYSFVIHEITLVTLLLTFDDHLTDIEKAGNDATSVLAAFGLGGIFGRLSVRYCGDKLLQEGSNAAAALLFILEGAVVVGILLSTNMYWIGTFYAILGFLEVGISTAVWNLVKDYIDVDAKSILFSTCTLVCGISALFVPYTIGLTRDDLGEYDGLLQITSGLSVLCAILCYVLPRFVDHSRHSRG